MTVIMYVCDPCFEGAPEGCGHFDRNDLRVVPATGRYADVTICRDCWDNWHDFRCDEPRPDWADLKSPPEFAPVREVR
ncbi:MAG: hypothetical protein RLZZ501_276 [Pseudomonadota bacterium]|jgi:hypothetical protein